MTNTGNSLFLLSESLTLTPFPEQVGLCLHQETADPYEARKFIQEACFDYEAQKDGVMLFRKPKRFK
ncbi:hypothetical protein A3K79_02655 [Candidatus Bathyarchaeota archaeon RBG_13_46_16b]|nr:MAG: hypothetical protein A3K79_02655 [Candidatus Bathyarchaeota archaeon RBG_13_46_16b]